MTWRAFAGFVDRSATWWGWYLKCVSLLSVSVELSVGSITVQARGFGDLDQGDSSGSIERWLDFGLNPKEAPTLLWKDLLMRRRNSKMTARILV